MAWRRLARSNLFRPSPYASLRSLLPTSSRDLPTSSRDPTRISPLSDCTPLALSPHFPILTGFLGNARYHRCDRRWYSVNQAHTQAPPAETGGELVEVPLAQTGEGIAECELLHWFVQEVQFPLLLSLSIDYFL